MARAVMFRNREGIHPKFITFDTRDMTPFEILLLSHCVTLTPGTTTVNIEKDYSRMVIHAFDADDPDAVREGITRKLKANILAWTRKEEA